MKAKHTAGPWVSSPLDFTIIRGSDGDIVAIVSERHRTREVQAANAALIGAAPELLATLKRIMVHFGVIPNGPDFPEAWAAIEKAEGK